ncbi:MAG: DUF1995 family protein [Cyanobacteria bacterium M_surface_10_m2_119]|nr:DUF1995 family protein [Cyanobacteria bacterium M_surface_10_m2_119]
MLPADLRSAEAQALEAVLAALPTQTRGRWSVEWRFEGLRLLPVALRFCASLLEAGHGARLLCPDAGAAALARRDAPELAEQVADFRGQMRRNQETSMPSSDLLLALAPAQPDYEEFEQLCATHAGPVVMLNGTLEDAAVGIGSVARERRRGFLAAWQPAYALQPQEGAALRFAYPGPWELYRQDPDGFRLAARFDQKPDLEAQMEALAGEQGPGVGGNLRALDAFIEGLRS